MPASGRASLTRPSLVMKGFSGSRPRRSSRSRSSLMAGMCVASGGAEKASLHGVFAALSNQTTVRQLCATDAVNQRTPEDACGRPWIGRCGSKTARLPTGAAPSQGSRSFKRRGRDLNPRETCAPNGFRDRCESANLQDFFRSCASMCASWPLPLSTNPARGYWDDLELVPTIDLWGAKTQDRTESVRRFTGGTEFWHPTGRVRRTPALPRPARGNRPAPAPT